MPLLHWLAEKPLTGSRIGWFVRQFGGGFGSEPMQIPGYRVQYLQLMDGARQEQSSRDHLEVIAAILDGDAARAGLLMRAHVREAGQLAQRIPNLLD